MSEGAAGADRSDKGRQHRCSAMSISESGCGATTARCWPLRCSSPSFIVFLTLHPRGFSPLVFQTAANEGAALALVAMAQTLPVLTGGLDLSIGPILALSNCLASNVVSGSPLRSRWVSSSCSRPAGPVAC